MKPRKVYKRKGIVHVCSKGGLFAPASGAASVIKPGDEVTVIQTSKECAEVFVAGATSPETWVLTEIGTTKRAGGVPRQRQARASATLKDTGPKYMVFLPPGSGGSTLGLPYVETYDEARDIAVKVIAEKNIDRAKWELCKWGAIHLRSNLRYAARVMHDGTVK